jgi:hypothetical protein
MKNVNPTPTPQAGVSPNVGRPKLILQFIHSYLPWLELVYFTLNLRMGVAVGTSHDIHLQEMSLQI